MTKFFKSSIVFSLSTAMLISTASASFNASNVRFEEKDGKMTATAYVGAFSGGKDGNMIIAKYDAAGNLKDAKIQRIEYNSANLEKNQENYFSVSSEAESGCTYKAFIWEGDNNTPVTLAATSTLPDTVPLLSGITVDGRAVDGFSAQIPSYNLTAVQGSVVPIVKGIPSDNSVYTTTIYEMSADKQSATAAVSAKCGSRTEQYVVNIACADSNVEHAVENYDSTAYCFTNLRGGTPGSKAANDYSAETYFFNTIPSEFEGCDYFVSRRYTTDKTPNIDFKLSADADVYVLSKGVMAGFDNYEQSDVSGIGIYALKGKFVTMLENAGITPTYADALLWQSSYANGSDAASIKALADKYSISADSFTNTPNTKWVIDAGKTYDTQYSKRFTAGSQISVASNNGGTSVLVVVKPVQPQNTGLKEHVTDFKQIVAGKSYSEYCEYIGITPNSEVTDTSVIPSAYKLSKFTVNADLCGNNSQRKITAIDELSGLENSYFISPDINVVSTDGSWVKAAFLGNSTDSKFSNLGKKAKWFEFKVNKDCEVIILQNDGESKLFDGDTNWTHTWQSVGSYDAKRNGTQQVKVHKSIYVREYNAGDTVELYNECSGSNTYTPYIAVIKFK